MLIFAVAALIVITAIACVGLVCAHFNPDDLRKMGIRL
jgi:hypothetical protein